MKRILFLLISLSSNSVLGAGFNTYPSTERQIEDQQEHQRGFYNPQNSSQGFQNQVPDAYQHNYQAPNINQNPYGTANPQTEGGFYGE